MPTGYSLHLGLNRTDPERYADGRYRRLFGCDLAADAMAHIAKTNGFTAPTVLKDNAAKLQPVTAWLLNAAGKAVAGDIVLFSFAGHGDRVRDLDHDEAGDQAMVLYDSLLIDDEIYEILGAFRADVRVVIVADCCYGGTLLWMIGKLRAQQQGRALIPAALAMPADRGPAFARPKVAANPLLLSASKDTTRAKAAQGPGNLPPYTWHLMREWTSNPKPQGGYAGLTGLIKNNVRDATIFVDMLNDPAIATQDPFSL